MNLAPPLSALLLLMAAAVGGADFSKVTELRRSGDYTQASSLLKNYSSPARYDSLPAPQRMEFLQGVLELAHIKALQNDVPGALALLNWAENLPEPYPRAYSCVKYAEILLDIGEPERARGYLKSFEEVRALNAKDNERGKAIGQGGRSADLGAAWRELAERAELLKAQAEFVELKEKFGATYATYVKLRRLQKQASKSKPDYENAMALADEIIKSAPDSQFAGAAGYLKGEIMAARLTEDSPKREIEAAKKYLRSFAEGRGAPTGATLIPQAASAYRGEALMLLGKISLEIEWDAKEAETHYTAALAHFRDARAKRDAVSLYAPLSEELKQQVTPTKKLTTLNEWKRIVYSSEDPLKLYNTAVAPPWYVEEKEKDCSILLGMFMFDRGDYAKAIDIWNTLLEMDSDIALLQSQNRTSILYRFRIACQTKKLIVSEDLRKKMSTKLQLPMLWAQILFGMEHFKEAEVIFQRIKKTAATDIEQIAVLIAIGENSTLLSSYDCPSREEWLKTGNSSFGKANELLRGSNTPEERDIKLRYIQFLLQNTNTHADAVPLAKSFSESYPQDVQYPWMLRVLLIDNLKQRNAIEVLRLYNEIGRHKNVAEIERQLKDYYFPKYNFSLKTGGFTGREKKE